MTTLFLFPELLPTMANPSNSTNDVFDVRRIRRLVELMQENDLTELDIQQGDMRIQLKRGGTSAVCLPPVTHVVASAAPVSPAPVSLPTPVAEEKNVHLITSPMVGTFFVASRPDAPPFVKVGDAVSPEKTVCMIEAMKVFNEIPAECNGKIVAVLAKNGESVEYGKPLFKVSLD